MSRFFGLILLLMSGWLGARLPLTDRAYQDLARGRLVALTGKPAASPAPLVEQQAQAPAGWIGSWALFQTYRTGGETGLRVLAAILMAGGTLILYLPGRNGSSFVAAAAAAALARSGLDLSTSLFSWPLLASTILCLRRLHQPAPWPLLFLPLPLGAWASLNREAAIGFGLLGLTLVVEAARWSAGAGKRRGERKRPELRQLLLLLGTGAAVAVVVYSPGGLEKIQNPLAEAILTREAALPEWDRVRFKEDSSFFLLATAAASLVALSPPAPALVEVLAAGVFLALSFLSRHFTVFFAAAAAIPAGLSLSLLARKLDAAKILSGKIRWSLSISVGAAAAATLPAALAPPGTHPFFRPNELILSEKLRGPIFNVPEAGGLLSWRLEPGTPAFADLSPSSIAAFRRLVASQRLPEILEKYGLHLALVSQDFAQAHAPDLQEIRARGWGLVYFDDRALLYVAPQSNREAVKELAFRYFDPLMPPEAYLPELVPLAIRELSSYLDRRPDSSLALLSLGGLLLREGKREEALEAFEAARRLGPADPAVLRSLSGLYLEKGMYRRAEEVSATAFELGGEAEMLYNLGLSLYGQGRYAEAARRFEELLAVDGENLRARRNLAELYRELGEEELSLRERERAARLEQSAIHLWRAEAERRRQALDFAAATRAYRRALEIRPGDAPILWELALVLLTQGQLQQSAETLRELVRAAPDWPEPHLILGALCVRRPGCRPEEARVYLQRFLELAPDDPNAALARSELAALAQRTKAR